MSSFSNIVYGSSTVALMSIVWWLCLRLSLSFAVLASVRFEVDIGCCFWSVSQRVFDLSRVLDGVKLGEVGGVLIGDDIFVKLGEVGGVLHRLVDGVGGVFSQVFGGRGAGGVLLAVGAILSSVIDDVVVADIMF